MLSSADILTHIHAAIEDGSLECVDLTHPLSEATPIIHLPEPFRNTPGWSLHEVSHYDEFGPYFYWNSFVGSEHMGTHFDAPIHWITGRNGEDVSDISPQRLIGPAIVIDRRAEVEANHDYLLTIDDIQKFEAEHGPLRKGAWLIYRTGWSTRYSDPSAFMETDARGSHWPGIDAECARFLAEETEIRGIGVEPIGIDSGQAHEFDPPYPVHHYFLGMGKFGLAQLAQLDRLPTSGSLLIPSPLRIVGGSGSPTRVVALVPGR